MSLGVNAPQGLVPTNYSLGAGTWSAAMNEYQIASGYATALFQGDPIAMLADGTIGIGVAGAGIIGVFNGCIYQDANGNQVSSPYWPAAATTLGGVTAQALIIDDQNILFSIQVSTSSVANPTVPVGLTLAQFNSNGNFAIGGGIHFDAYTNANIPVGSLSNNPATGNTRTANSGYYLDITTLDTTSTLSLKLVRLDPMPGNVYFTAIGPTTGIFNNALVLINNDTYKGGTGTVGV